MPDALNVFLGNAFMPTVTRHIVSTLIRPIQFFRTYERKNLRPDFIAGITVAVVLLPQAIAFALIAELPPEMGLYAAVMGGIVGALWGSSNQIHTGPTNAISLLVLSTLLTVTTPGTHEFLVAAGVLAVLAGIFQLLMGLARLGILVNFVSHSVVVGFSAGAGVLIIVKQLRHMFRLDFGISDFPGTIKNIIINIPDIHLITLVLGLSSIVLILVFRKFKPRWPSSLIVMAAASVAVFLLGLDKEGVLVINELPKHLPPLADLPLLDRNLIAHLSTGALAVAAIGLVETSAISRAIAAQTGQRLNSNQEFVGQGLANIFSGLFSGYPRAGSFSRSAVNFRAGAKTPMAAIFSGGFVCLAMLALAPLASYLPRAALAAVLIITAVGVIDHKEMTRIWKGTRGDTFIMVVTFLGTLFLHIEFAVLAGILLSFGVYIMRTSAPRVYPVVPDKSFRNLVHDPQRPSCPQLGVINILGDLYFGAASHIEESVHEYKTKYPSQRFLILRMRSVNQCDFTGIHMLESLARTYRELGGDIYLVHIRDHVLKFMKSTHFYEYLGANHFLKGDTAAIEYLFYKIIDPAICIYECHERIFKECQNLPRDVYSSEIPVCTDVPAGSVPEVLPEQLWKDIHAGSDAFLVLDVREPREFGQEHIAGAQSKPLPTLLMEMENLQQDQRIVLVCRSGRRSLRAAWMMSRKGFTDVSILGGGLVAWKAAGLLTAVVSFDTR